MFYKLLLLVALALAVLVLCLPTISVAVRALLAILVASLAAETAIVNHERNANERG